MQVFKTDTKTYLANEFKSWGWTFAFAFLLFLGFKLFSSLPQDRFLIGVVVLILLKIGDAVTQFHVKRIEIDANTNQVTFILNSIISGQKINRYDLRQVKSELQENSTLTKILNSPVSLKISLSNNDFFRIDSRYGFSVDALNAVDNALKTTNNLMVSQ